MNVMPLGENVLVSFEKPEKKTESGIFLPENATEDRSSKRGCVVAVGESEKIRVKPGQDIIYTRYGGTDIKISGMEYSIVKNEDILAVITE
ncbi:MAG: co-chaperone GroES [Candidatus Moraniibacteriota bacterium]|nr:MAG: co-chaperone GroES [Candidatus Moranbacteria bacterium]